MYSIVPIHEKEKKTSIISVFLLFPIIESIYFVNKSVTRFQIALFYRALVYYLKVIYSFS